MSYLLCARCGSDEIVQTVEGDFECQSCGFRFSSPSTSTDQLVELKIQTALLRKILALLKRHFQRAQYQPKE
jgi:uncharacterized membrane protein YvbJ